LPAVAAYASWTAIGGALVIVIVTGVVSEFSRRLVA
jgi:hypothetical protein